MQITRLRHLEGPEPGKLVELYGSRCVIGRAPGCDLVLESTRVSRRHCELRIEDGAGQLLDQSKGGTYVNGVRVDETWLEVGDRIRLGEFELELVDLPGANLAHQSRGLLFGKLAVRLGLLVAEDVTVALRAQNELREKGEAKRIGELLVEQGKLSAGKRDLVLELQSLSGLSEKEANIGKLAMRNGLIDRSQLVAGRKRQRELSEGSTTRDLLSVMVELGFVSSQDAQGLSQLQKRELTQRVERTRVHTRPAPRPAAAAPAVATPPPAPWSGGIQPPPTSPPPPPSNGGGAQPRAGYRECGSCCEIVATGLDHCPSCGAFLGQLELQALCPACGELAPEKARFCSACGASMTAGALPVGMDLACRFCGGTILTGQPVCPECGHPQGKWQLPFYARRAIRHAARLRGLVFWATGLALLAFAVWYGPGLLRRGLELALGEGKVQVTERTNALFEAYRFQDRAAVLQYVPAAARGEKPKALWERLLGKQVPDDLRLKGFSVKSCEVEGGSAKCYVTLTWHAPAPEGKPRAGQDALELLEKLSRGAAGRAEENLTVHWRKLPEGWLLALPDRP